MLGILSGLISRIGLSLCLQQLQIQWHTDLLCVVLGENLGIVLVYVFLLPVLQRQRISD